MDVPHRCLPSLARFAMTDPTATSPSMGSLRASPYNVRPRISFSLSVSRTDCRSGVIHGVWLIARHPVQAAPVTPREPVGQGAYPGALGRCGSCVDRSVQPPVPPLIALPSSLAE